MDKFEFELSAKCVLVDTIKDIDVDEVDRNIKDFKVIWSNDMLGAKEVILLDLCRDNRLYRVRYDTSLKNFYVNVFRGETDAVLKDKYVKELVSDKMVSRGDTNRSILIRKMKSMSNCEGLSYEWKSVIDEAVGIIENK